MSVHHEEEAIGEQAHAKIWRHEDVKYRFKASREFSAAGCMGRRDDDSSWGLKSRHAKEFESWSSK